MLLSTSDLTFHRRFSIEKNRTKQRKYIYLQTEICSSKQLDCLNSLVVDTEDCLEQCEGTIADVLRQKIDKIEDGLETFLQDYERFKFSESFNYPSIGHGTVFTMLP